MDRIQSTIRSSLVRILISENDSRHGCNVRGILIINESTVDFNHRRQTDLVFGLCSTRGSMATAKRNENLTRLLAQTRLGL